MHDAEDHAPPIDRRELDSSVLMLCSDGDPDFARLLLGDFLDHLDGYIEALATASTPLGWSDGAHRIKGAARSVGAVAIAGVAAVIEYAPPDCADAGEAAVSRLRALAASLRRLHEGQAAAA